MNTDLLVQFSSAVTARAAAVRGAIAAIRLADGRHLSATLWQADVAIASEQALPRRDEFELVLAGGAVAKAKLAGRDPGTNIAALRLASRSRTALEPVLPWIVALWLAGVLVLSARLAWGWIATRRLGAMGTRPAPVACVEALERLAAKPLPATK